MREQHKLENELEEVRVSVKRAEEKEKAAKKRAQEATAALCKSEKERKEAIERLDRSERERLKLNEKYIKLSQRLKDQPQAPLSARETSHRALDEINTLKLRVHKLDEELALTKHQLSL
jgi:hypothetical protein